METKIEDIKELPLLDRPREKLLRAGAKSLTNTELLAILFGSGTKNSPIMSICRELIAAIDNDVRQFRTMDIGPLCRIKGIGEVKAIILLAALELGKRAMADDMPLVLREDKDVETFIMPYLHDKENAQYFLVLFNHRHELLATNELATVGGQLPQLNPIIKLCLEAGATACMICRNDLILPEQFINREKAFIIQLDAAASMLKVRMRGLLVVETNFQDHN